MILESLSPPLRRIMAVGLLLVGLLLAWQLIAAPLLGAIADGRRALSESRFRVAQLQALIDAPPPPAPPAALQGQLLRAPDKTAAEARLLALLRDLAGRQGLRFEGAALASGKDVKTPRPVRIQLTAEGPPDALTQWIYAIESGELVLRFASADYAGDGDGRARLTGELRAIWVPSR